MSSGARLWNNLDPINFQHLYLYSFFNIFHVRRGEVGNISSPSFFRICAETPDLELLPALRQKKHKILIDQTKIVTEQPEILIEQTKILIEQTKILIEQTKIDKILIDQTKILIEQTKIVTEQPEKGMVMV